MQSTAKSDFADNHRGRRMSNPTPITDSRKYMIMTLDDADRIMAEIAALTIENEILGAQTAKKINDAKLELDKCTRPRLDRIGELARELERYINAHRDQFIKPRKRVTKYGSYGLQTVSNLMISDAEALLAYCAIHQRSELTDVKTTVNKDAVAKAVAAGEELPGCDIVTGERVNYKVAKELIDDARNKVL